MRALHNVLNMPEYVLTAFLGSKYARILNSAEFWICKSYTKFWISHNMVDYVLIGREYAWICLNLQK